MRRTLIEHSRERAIEEIKQRLLSSGDPRLEMFVILSVTGTLGFFASLLMLNLGITNMALRYPLAVLFAYCTFLMLLRIWLSFKCGREIEPDVDVDVPDIDLSQPHHDAGPGSFEFGGGGGGADTVRNSVVSRSASGSKTIEGGGGFSVDLDDGWLIVLAIAALAGALIVCAYVVYSAPVFLAEILLDSLLLAGLYRKLKKTEGRHWVLSAVSRSWIPIVLVMVFFAIAGYLMQLAAPEAHSIGQVWTQFKAE
jgi:hypothetical protein